MALRGPEKRWWRAPVQRRPSPRSWSWPGRSSCRCSSVTELSSCATLSLWPRRRLRRSFSSTNWTPSVRRIFTDCLPWFRFFFSLIFWSLVGNLREIFFFCDRNETIRQRQVGWSRSAAHHVGTAKSDGRIQFLHGNQGSRFLFHQTRSYFILSIQIASKHHKESPMFFSSTFLKWNPSAFKTEIRKKFTGNKMISFLVIFFSTLLDELIDWLTCCLTIDWLIDWLTCCSMFDWLIDWLVV